MRNHVPEALAAMTVEPVVLSVRSGLFEPPVYRAGSGEPLVFLHGAGGLGHGSMRDLETLARDYDTIAPVLPGWDDTDGLQHVDDVHDMVVFLQDFVDAAGLRSFFLMGHSLGGMFASELAAARPDLVRKLVLVAPIGLWLDESPVADFFTALPSELPQLLCADPADPTVAALFQPPSDSEERAHAMYLQLANFAAAGKFMWPIPDRGLKKRLHRVKAPTLVLWGESDRVLSPAYGHLFETKIPNAELVTIPGAGHLLPLEKTEQLVAEVRRFLG
ncbi:MAG: alpha/beta hydrolase [Dehalococcoidia bacterium]|nr:alpha/beta hydrolase [Dehalococcoidia bacterium]